MSSTQSRRRKVAAVTSLAMVGALGLAACGGGSSKSGSSKPATSASAVGAAQPTGTRTTGGDVNVALTAATVNWIWPFSSLANASQVNSYDLQQPQFETLYYFGGENGQPTVDYTQGPANAPVYSNGGKTVTITMKGWKWSNGETVDANDVVFFMHMLMAEKTNFYGYTPGFFPDNVKSVTATSPNTVTFQLTSAYSSDWFTYNQLSQVTPMPMAWDVTSMGAAAGSGGCTQSVSKCAAVFNFLNAQSKNQGGYQGSKLWGVVDGPFKLGNYSSQGQFTLNANPTYSGSPKPSIAAINFLPFTTDSAEYNALKSGAGNIDIGAIPPQDLPQKPASSALPSVNPIGNNVNMEPAYTWSVNYFPMNFNNPKLGPAFKQLYVRQALAEVMNQEVDANKAERGYGYPNYGPVPVEPSSKWLSPAGQSGKAFYPFSPTAAKALLTSHGWTESGGVMSCTKPGSASNECGAGVAAGTKLNIQLDYASGAQSLDLSMQQFKSDASTAGISINLTQKPFNSVIGEAAPCKSTQATCNWEMANWGGGWIYSPDFLPTGELLFQTGAGSNSGSFSDATIDSLIKATTTTSGTAPVYTYEDALGKALPVMFQANSYGVATVSKRVGGVVFNPLQTLNAQYWYTTK